MENDEKCQQFPRIDQKSVENQRENGIEGGLWAVPSDQKGVRSHDESASAARELSPINNLFNSMICHFSTATILKNNSLFRMYEDLAAPTPNRCALSMNTLTELDAY